mgnify:CR=1 FL=1
MDSPIISEGRSGPHSIQGIGAGFIPDTLDLDVLDDVIKVTKEEAFESARKLAREEGIFGGIFNYDTGERYLSLDGLFK